MSVPFGRRTVRLDPFPVTASLAALAPEEALSYIYDYYMCFMQHYVFMY